MPQKPARARLSLTLALTLAALATGLPDSRAAKMAWQAISDEERAATASTIQPDAGAEVLYRYKQVDDSKPYSDTTNEYWRIKVYNENGIRALSKIEIPYDPKTETIMDLAACVIRPDGSDFELGKKDFFNREAAKLGAQLARDLSRQLGFDLGSQSVRVISFSFPELTPGTIVEYQFRRVSNKNLFMVRLDFMADMPVRRVMLRYKLAPLAAPWATLSVYHLTNGNRKRAKDGFYYFEMTNLKSCVEEPYMPPSNEVRPWMMFYPARGGGVPTLFWDDAASSLSKAFETCSNKGSQLVTAQAANLTRGITSPLKKAAALNDFCRSRIVNLDYMSMHEPPDPKLLTKDPRCPDDVIMTKKGRSQEIQFLFVALARSLGLDAYPALCPRRGEGMFSRQLLWAEYLRNPVVAVRVGSAWHFFDPTNCVVDTGMLQWNNEGQPALIAQGQKGLWQTTPVAPAEKSRAKRTADLRLDEDGTLSGEVRLEMTGQAACDMRMRYTLQTDTAIEEKTRAAVQARMPGAEVSDVTASGFEDMLKPFVLAYKVRVPGYAEQTGRRMFVQPGFFTKGATPWFTAATRAYDICFDYPMLQEDRVSIKPPIGYSIEEGTGSAPQGITRTNWGQYAVTLGAKKLSGEIVYTRTFEYSRLRAPAAEYDAVKKLFDFIHTQDTHVLTLKKDN